MPVRTFFKDLPVGTRFRIAGDNSKADVVFTKIKPTTTKAEIFGETWIPPANAIPQGAKPLFMDDSVEVDPIPH